MIKLRCVYTDTTYVALPCCQIGHSPSFGGDKQGRMIHDLLCYSRDWVCMLNGKGRFYIFFSEIDILTRISKVVSTYARTWKSFKIKEMAFIYFFGYDSLGIFSLGGRRGAQKSQEVRYLQDSQLLPKIINTVWPWNLGMWTDVTDKTFGRECDCSCGVSCVFVLLFTRRGWPSYLPLRSPGAQNVAYVEHIWIYFIPWLWPAAKTENHDRKVGMQAMCLRTAGFPRECWPTYLDHLCFVAVSFEIKTFYFGGKMLNTQVLKGSWNEIF